ncbi:30S ribosomal protein S3 [Candidatus Parcubacteria bacterium]|jgi:small subunit ribosomal protein S3|nr:30S ribosomal protein S3 [Candidatus Parcubacteria bacterium]MBT7228719.1 30S ribosomal protein S3 [Candidatus Parcubacteria bacterium]
MGKKVNPRIFRIGLSEKWRSRWFSNRDFAKFLEQDIRIRKFLQKKLGDASVDRVDIERSRGKIIINISAAKPGLIIGRGGSGIEDLKKRIKKEFLDQADVININITEVSIPNLSANVILQSIKEDVEKRIPFRRVMKQNIDKVMKAGSKGVKIILAGRLNGVDIARTEKLIQGSIPLQTLRANIDYSRGVANTIYGTIGIKVWIYKGQWFDVKKKEAKKEAPVKSVKLFSKEKLNIQPVGEKKPVKAETKNTETKKEDKK